MAAARRVLANGEAMIDVLVTGGAGFIGSNFVRHALAAHPDWRVTTLDKLTYAGRIETLSDVMDHPRHAFVRGDIADDVVATPLVQRSHIVVHFAAETHVDRSIASAGDFIIDGSIYNPTGSTKIIEHGGSIVQQNAIGKIRFNLEAGGHVYGSINAENWRAWNFNVADHTGTEVARITKTWEGLAKTVFTTADNFVVQIHRPLEEPLRTLVVASSLAVDTALKQDKRGFG